MLYLLLVFPVLVLFMGAISRSGKLTATDTACLTVDLELDRRADLARAGSPSLPTSVPQARQTSRVAPREFAHSGAELLVG